MKSEKQESIGLPCDRTRGDNQPPGVMSLSSGPWLPSSTLLHARPLVLLSSMTDVSHTWLLRIRAVSLVLIHTISGKYMQNFKDSVRERAYTIS